MPSFKEAGMQVKEDCIGWVLCIGGRSNSISTVF